MMHSDLVYKGVTPACRQGRQPGFNACTAAGYKQKQLHFFHLTLQTETV